MIYLTKGQPLADNPNLVVYDPTGYYNDGDSVICAPVGLPDEPACRYEAKYILYGGMVYSISNPDDLMTEVLKIDPDSLFGKDNQQIAVDKMVEKIVPQEPGQAIEEATTEEVDPISDLPSDLPIEEATSTTPTIEPVDDQVIDLTSTTSPSSTIEPMLPDNISTTTPATTISSSTPNPAIEILDNSTTSTTTETVTDL